MQDQQATQALEGGSRRYAPRYALHLPASGADAGTSFDACIRTISTTGLSIEASTDLETGGRAEIDLPGNGLTPVTVIWRDGRLSGCIFDAPITKSIVAATRLKGDPVSQVPAAAAPMATSAELTGTDRRWSGSARLLIAISAALAAWAIFLAPIAIFA